MAGSIIDDERVLPGKLLQSDELPFLTALFLSLDAVPIIREFLRSIYTKHSTAFVQVMQTLNEPLRMIISKHLQTN